MMNAVAFALAAWAARAVAEGAQYHHANHALAPALFARDTTCLELPKLCTDDAVLHGVTTHLTYLCPEPTGLTTVHVTKTITTTVTAVPTDHDSNPTPILDPDKSLISYGHTTTTTIKSTFTEHRTITVFSKKSSSVPALPSLISTGYFSEGIIPTTPGLLPPHITWSFSQGIPPSQLAEATGLTLPLNNSSSSSSTVNSTYYAPTAIYPNSTSRDGYAKPTANIVREARVSETMFPIRSMANHNKAYSLALFPGLIAFVFIF